MKRPRLLGAGAVIILGGALLAMDVASPAIPRVSAEPVFSGRALLGVSDADMAASGYSTGTLRQLPGVRDALSVTTLPLAGTGAPQPVEIHGPNSVIGWPQILDVSPDGMTAYVAEIRGEAPPNTDTLESAFDELPPGALLSIYDISDPAAPALLDQGEVGVNPSAISASPDGRFVVTSSDEAGGAVVIVDVAGGQVGERFVFPLPTNLADYVRGGVRSIVWNPKFSDLLGANIGDTQIALIKIIFDETGRPASIAEVGERITIGIQNTTPAFTPDGKHLIVSDIGWFGGLRGYLFNDEGRLYVTSVDADNGLTLIQDVQTGLSPEGFDISPDGRLVATVDMGRTFLPPFLGWWPHASRSSLTLFERTPETGQLTRLGTWGFKGVLPEDLVFDNDSQGVAVAIYEGKGAERDTGFIEYWRVVEKGGQPALARTGLRVPVTRGVHDLVVAR